MLRVYRLTVIMSIKAKRTGRIFNPVFPIDDGRRALDFQPLHIEAATCKHIHQYLRIAFYVLQIRGVIWNAQQGLKFSQDAGAFLLDPVTAGLYTWQVEIGFGVHNLFPFLIDVDNNVDPGWELYPHYNPLNTLKYKPKTGS